MKDSGSAKPTGKTAIEVSKNLELGAPAQELLKDDLLPRPFLEQLIEKGFYRDAARFMAHSIPKRAGVWWACRCARVCFGDKPPPKIAAALDSAEKWLADPSDENRRATFELAKIAGYGNAAGLIGMGVFYSSGSLAPKNLPTVPPAEYLTAKMSGNAVILSAVQPDPVKAEEKYKLFFKMGFEVAEGKSRWKGAP